MSFGGPTSLQVIIAQSLSILAGGSGEGRMKKVFRCMRQGAEIQLDSYFAIKNIISFSIKGTTPTVNFPVLVSWLLYWHPRGFVNVYDIFFYVWLHLALNFF